MQTLSASRTGCLNTAIAMRNAARTSRFALARLERTHPMVPWQVRRVEEIRKAVEMGNAFWDVECTRLASGAGGEGGGTVPPPPLPPHGVDKETARLWAVVNRV